MDLNELKGSWALVTGASAGIGREFALQLAARGLNVALIARRSDVLASLAEELQARHSVRALSVPADLAAPDAVDLIRSALVANGVRPRLLVNNAGVGRWGRFESADRTTLRDIVVVNALAMVELCREFLPELTAGAPSAIVNVSSQAALQPVPYMATYAATKVFVHHLSLGLFEEFRARGVYVQTLVPGPTATEFDAKAGAYDSALSARRASPGVAVSASLEAFAGQPPLVVTASGTLGQRLFAALAPTRMVLAKVGQMFRPPQA